AAFETAFKAVATKLVTGALGTGPGVDVASACELGLKDLIKPNCDGPVAIANIEVTGATLKQWTASGQHIEDRFDPGYNSRDTCGSNSKYTVTWAVDRAGTPLAVRADLNGLR